MLKPIAPNCQDNCPTIEDGEDGDSLAYYCNSCNEYLEQTVRDLNAARILADMNADPSLS